VRTIDFSIHKKHGDYNTVVSKPVVHKKISVHSKLIHEPGGRTKFFQTLTRLASSLEFSLAKSKNNLLLGEEESIRGEKESLASLLSGLLFLLTKPA
jgi:hypothetical protein